MQHRSHGYPGTTDGLSRELADAEREMGGLVYSVALEALGKGARDLR